MWRPRSRHGNLPQVGLVHFDRDHETHAQSPVSPRRPIEHQMGTIYLFVRSLAVMRHVKIIERPNETYPFAAIDQQTGEIPLRLTERGDLVALCDRLGWVVREDFTELAPTKA
jgi:hypothetical protein